MAQTLKLATWNINSVRLRIDQVVRFLEETQPDLLCLQEIKCAPTQFPEKPLADAGYPHQAVVGQRGMHGVAIVSRLPLETLTPAPVCGQGQARAVFARVAGVEVHNYYVPAGGDEPDPEANPKFAHKLDFLSRLKAHYADTVEQLQHTPVVVTGDLNVAPGEFDVWSHKQLLNVVSHTPVETDGLAAVREAGGFVDVVRAAIPDPEKVYTWWSYRARDWRKSNRGRRLDHIWLSPALAGRQGDVGREAVSILDTCRDWDKPSDHVPVIARLTL